MGWLAGLFLVVACATSWRAPMSGGGSPNATALAADGELARLTAIAQRQPLLGDYVLYFQASKAASAGHTTDAIEYTRRLLETHPDSVWTGSGRLLLGRLLRRSRDFTASRSWLESARATLPEGSLTWARACVALAEVSHRLGAEGTSIEPLREVRRRFARGALARRSRRLVRRIRKTHPELIPWDLADEAEMRLREDDPRGAARMVTLALGDGTAPEPLYGHALYVRALVERALGDRLAAEASALQMARTLSDHPLAPKALLAVAGWRWNADDDATALRLFAEVMTRFPRSSQVGDALYGTGRIHQEARHYRDAFEAYRRLAETLPDHTLAVDADWRAGWVRYLETDYAGAARWFGRKTTSRASGRAAADYWQARALERLGRGAEAAKLLDHVIASHSTSYYAELAEVRLGRPAATTAPSIPAPASFPTELFGPHAERARTLAAAGFSHFARLELDALRDGDETHHRQLLDAYTAVGAPSAAINLAREMQPPDAQPDAPGPFQRYLHPLGYWSVVAGEAQRRGVDPILVLSIIRQESLFNADAVSPANAHGLMQLLPSTAGELARADGVPSPTPTTLHSPSVNISFGVEFLRQLLDRYNGSRVKALAAYNAGPDAVAKWERRYGGHDADEFVELITYRETRDYVKAVLGNYRIYRLLYVESPSTTSDGRPPNAPFDMIAMTSPGWADATR